MKHVNRSLIAVLALMVFAVLVVGCGGGQNEQASDQEVAGEPAESAAPPVHWDYGSEYGPSQWASIDPAYSECGQGHLQSPIDIAAPTETGHPEWATEYGTTDLQVVHNQHVKDVVDNGHTIQVNYDQGSELTVGDEVFELKQFHFHTPSENTVGGEHYPMEMHMVHQAADGKLAVYAVFMQEGDHNPNFDALVGNLPGKPGDKVDLQDVEIDINKLIPGDRNAYHFMGSLTTPPCSEQVNWLVAVQPVALAPGQIGEFSKRLGKNNRPTQPANNRPITVDEVP